MSTSSEIYQGSSMAKKAIPPWIPMEAGKIMSFETLNEKGITEVKGEIGCTKCNATRVWTITISEYTKYEATTFVNRSVAAPYRGTQAAWFNPELPNCEICEEEGSMEPVDIEEEHDDDEEPIDWLFLFLAQMVGFCSLDQLSDYCAMNEIVTPKNKFQAIKQVYRHLLHQFLAN